MLEMLSTVYIPVDVPTPPERADKEPFFLDMYLAGLLVAKYFLEAACRELFY